MTVYTQKILRSGKILREFSRDSNPDELHWHRDYHDRTILVVESGGWALQFDNKLPKVMNEGDIYFVKAGSWHRVIKGTDRLIVEIKEHKGEQVKITKRQLAKMVKEAKDQNKDGENDFDDVKIARMLASGMTKEEIKKKHPELFKEYKDSGGNPVQYGAPPGSKRAKQLKQTRDDLARAKKLRKDGKAKQAKELEQRAYKRRDRMEEKERQKKESVRMTETELRELIREVLTEKLSKKTKATLKKKAEKRGLTPGSVYKEFEKGLAAYATSGSRKGMSAHQWAHARVNSATPSKSWAVVKKSKAKKKKK